MDNLQKNLLKVVPTVPGMVFDYLKKALIADLSYPFKKKLKGAIAFPGTLENIHVLGGYTRQADHASTRLS